MLWLNSRAPLLAAGFMLCAAPTMAQTQATINKLNEAWCAAFNKGDAVAIAAMYTDDATVLPQGGPMIKGATAIKDMWAGEVKTLGDAKLTTVELHTMGEVMAYEIGTATANTKGDQPHQVAGKYLVIWRRSGTTWKIAADIFNFDN
jgi:uncharacterized protein (TIGR02246 family)